MREKIRRIPRRSAPAAMPESRFRLLPALTKSFAFAGDNSIACKFPTQPRFPRIPLLPSFFSFYVSKYARAISNFLSQPSQPPSLYSMTIMARINMVSPSSPDKSPLGRNCARFPSSGIPVCGDGVFSCGGSSGG